MAYLDPAHSGTQLIDGPAGELEVIVDLPKEASKGAIVVAHPQPLLGGSAQHKVPYYLARSLVEAGWSVFRPNFRGVGRSAGQHDQGRGEAEDLVLLCAQLRSGFPNLRLGLFGFSFGAFVQAQVARRMLEQGKPAWRTCLAGMPYGVVEGGRRYDTPDGLPNLLVIHGERDERVPLSSVLNWGRPQSQPVVVIPGADHFFTGRLPILRSLVLDHFTYTAL